MKKLFIGMIGLGLLVVVLALVFINPILEKAKPMILDAVSKAMETTVTAGNIEVGLFPSPNFKLENVKLGSGEESITLGKAKIAVSFSKLLKKEISMETIELTSASIKAHLNEDGSFLVDGIKLPKKPNPSESKEVKVPVTEASQVSGNETSKSDGTKLVIAIENLLIKDINVIAVNEKTKTDLKLNLKSLSLKKDGERAKVEIDSEVANGKVGFSGYLSTYQFQDPDIKVSGNIDGNFPDLLPVFAFLGKADSPMPVTKLAIKANLQMPGIKIESLDGELAEQKFNISGDIPDMKAGSGKFSLKVPAFSMSALKQLSKAPMVGSYDGTLKDFNCEINVQGKERINTECKLGSSDVNSISVSISDLSVATLIVEPKSTDLNKLNLNVGSGQVSLKGKILPNAGTNISVNGQGLAISDLLKFTPDPAGREKPISGILTKLSSDLKMNGASKSGPFSVVISPFSIKGFNIFKKISDALDIIPGLSLSLISAVPESHGAILLSQNSEFQSVSASGSIMDSKINLTNFEAKSKGYSISGQGVMDNGAMDLKVKFIVDRELVSLLEARNPKISKVKNLDGTIVLPLEITKSKEGVPIIIPDAKDLLKSQLGIQAKEGAKKALDKVAPGLGGVVDGLFN